MMKAFRSAVVFRNRKKHAQRVNLIPNWDALEGYLKKEHLKILIIFTTMFWVVYDFGLMNYTASLFDALSIVSNVVGLIMILKGNQSVEA